MSGNLKNIRLVLMLMFIFVTCSVSAQTIKGTVKDSSGEPIIGASVIEKGTSKGTVTDLDGNFTISVSGKKPLVVSYIGMKKKEVSIAGKSVIDIVLEDANTTLNEVVAIGYGTVRKKDLTGSVGTIKGSTLASIPVPNIGEALAGKLSGVRVTTTDGSPDAEVVIRVHGGGSITGSNTPLYIVDGFTVNSINDISPNDIEDMTVLKDASSTAIYGSRGANGVILITTKKAEGGKTRINYNGFVQTKKIAKRLDAMNAYDYVMSNYEYALLKGSDAVKSFESNFGVYDDLDLYKYIGATDWQDDMFGANVLSQQQNISITGGTEKTNFMLSGTYDYNGGLMVNNDFSRYAFEFKLNHQIAKNLKFGLNVRVNDQTVNGSGTQGGTYKIRTSQAITSAATKGLSAFTTIDTSNMSDDEYEQYIENNMSLSEQAQRYWKKQNTRGYNFNASLDWTIIKGLVAHTEVGYGYGFRELKNWWGANTTQASYVGGLPLADWKKTNTRSMREEFNLTYNFKVNKDHNFNVMIGQEIISEQSDYSYMYATKFSKAYSAEVVFNNFGLSNGVSTLTSVVNPDYNLESYFGRLNYNYKDKYLFALTAREDGSSKFGMGKKWGFFPSAAIGWRIIEEPFMTETKSWLSNLKLRFSYGEVGNDGIASTQYKPVYSLNSDTHRYGVGDVDNNQFTTGSTLTNPNIKWETTTTRNIGFDFGFLNERISGGIEVYWNTTKDLLLERTITAPGYTKTIENIGQTSNHGVDFNLNASIIRSKNLSLDANFNIGFNKSNVDKLNGDQSYMNFPSGWAGTDSKNPDDYIVRVGSPMGLVYGWICDGYYTTSDFSSYDAKTNTYTLKKGVATTSLEGGAIGIRPGAMKLRDLDNNGVVDLNDRTQIGDTNPTCQGGFGLNARYYGFDLSTNFTYSIGNDIYNANKIASTQQYRSGTYPNMLSYMNQSNSYSYMNPETGALMTSLEDLAYWNEGGNGKAAKQYWSPYSFGSAVVVPTSWAIEDGSFLRLQSITFGYTLPKRIINKIGIQNLRFYCTATNLFCITNYSGYDPEVSSYSRNSSYSGLTPGIDYSSYPKSRAFTFGINVTL